VIYSWRLVKTDPLPDGKRECVPLRDQIEEIRKLKDKGVLYGSGQMTVLELVEKYLKTKTGVKESTKAGYKTVTNMLKEDPFGSNQIHQVKQSDTKVWLIGLQKAGRGYSSIHSIRGVLRPAFQMAVDDDLLVKNPFEWQLATVIVNDSVTREAITQAQERKFLNFVREDKHYCRYYDGMYLLFRTGLRISEFCGLTVKDIDLKNRKIIVDHQLQRR
jgi:site-specific recombinase XerD